MTTYLDGRNLLSVGVPALGLALVAPILGGPAAVTVGIVLVEAIVLYVGYGVLARAVGPTVRELLASD